MARDNGMMNSIFLRRCEKIGYVHSGQLLKEFRILTEFKWDDDQEVAALNALGYKYRVKFPQSELGHDRKTMQRWLNEGEPFRAWTHVYNRSYDSCIFFTDEKDAIRFKLSI